ncbi:MAG: RNA-binding protein [Deltaproteobacteria bacterium CG2_30_63_29]|nr:MAG: RNA-binding protein [Deltaproteobacteria bacterium CG2_30_63_29]PJB35617.1 MAG: RNA-binding protein [Deltaproteobacteria bacterium CG_4_9_14_3_um_filter_63_12]
MAKKLFVGGLSWGTDDGSLRKAFEEFGEVSEAKVITDRDSGRSRGFGFVTFEEPAAAESAISALDGQELDGRAIRVNVAEEKKPRQTNTQDRGGRRGW